LLQQLRERRPAFGLQERVVAPRGRVVDVGIGRHDVVVTGQHDRHAARKELLRMLVEGVEPFELVVELRPGLRVAVGQVEAADEHAADDGFEIAALRVFLHARQATPGFDRLAPARQYGDAIPGALPVRDGAIARAPDRIERQVGVGRLEFL
jgi:hypothetical protein